MLLQGRLLIDADTLPAPGWIRVEDGRIAEIGDGEPPQPVEAGGPDSLITPGFVDAHVHLPQIDAIGCDELELLPWLDRVIYPAEAAWADQAFAEAQALDAYRRMLHAGTLGFAGYLTSHSHGVAAATKAAHRIPLRGIVGQSLMDREAPADLLRQPAARLVRSERGRLDASLNPRFAVSCSDLLLARTGKLLAEGFPFSFKQRDPGDMGTTLFLQTHLAETIAECDRVAEMFPDDPHYAGVYDRHGLLTPHTLLAHGVHLSPAEWALIAERDSIVVHCPSANTFLRSGLFDLRAAREHGVRLALGSDVAAGCDLAMPRVARSMIEVAKLRRLAVDPEAVVPTPAEAWTMITRGNANALCFTDMGRLEVGAPADVLVLEPHVEFDVHLIGRLIHTWRDEYITHRVVRGVLHQ
jgi:guanine deaminase